MITSPLLCCVDLSVPQDVQLVATDCHTVLMSWHPPVQSYGRIAGYTIWMLDGVRDEYITVHSGCSFKFTKLEPGRDVLASVRAQSYPLSSMRLTYVGTFSTAAKVTTPQCEEGEFAPPLFRWLGNE